MEAQAMQDMMPEGSGDGERARSFPGPVAFWALLVGVLVVGLLGGVALTTYLLPPGLLPGDPNAEAVDTFNERNALEAEINEDVEAADASSDEFDVLVEGVNPALIYTVREINLATCVDYMGFHVDGMLRTLRLTDIYAC